MVGEETRELTVVLKVKTYGTKKQARATSERIRRMLSTELHQDVELVRTKQRVVK